MLYFAQNVPILSNKNSTKGRDDLAADSVFPVRASAAPAPGCGIGYWRVLPLAKVFLTVASP